MDPDPFNRALKDEAAHLRARYIEAYVPARPEHKPETFEYDVKAYLLLFHAAFEEFVEAISEGVLGQVETDFLAKKITLATVCLLAAHGISFTLPDLDNEADQTSFEHVREGIEAAKRAHSKALKDNHGISPKYLRWLLIPVGLNVPRGPEVDSLKKLANARGSFAHTMAKLAKYGDYKKATDVMTPEVADDVVVDCLKIADDLCAGVKAAW
ncbi:hypothetical protein [Sphingosinithalassobacter portus]|uniref:hypothetical protein n=1 Tax=Stakelama portus TaxID=2676234 RepID=UPI000D6DF7F4|nr:hypothetical protein [Sphingosinithalassobacter portus]